MTDPAISRIFDEEHKADRARRHTTGGGNEPAHNGIRRVIVSLETGPKPSFAWLDVELFNGDVALSEIVGDISSAAKTPRDIFTIRGGSRIRAGEQPGQVQVTEVHSASASNILRLKVAPVGDYSTYTLRVDATDYDFDPLFAGVDFKFRPGCFNTNCAPARRREASPEDPAIDYLVRDFDSFKHELTNAMRARVPDWQPTSEADLDMVLVDLLAAAGDELADFQDRVMNEAYFGRARKRVSLARYARLMDYHVHQGNQAGTWLAVMVSEDQTIPRGFGVWTGRRWQDASAVIYTATHDQACFAALNELSLYSWGGVVTALEAGSTEAELIVPAETMTETEANGLRDRFRRDDVSHLLIEQKLNPETGTIHGIDRTARQVVRLLGGEAAADSVQDPVQGTWLVRVRWRAEDRLRRRYCFITQCDGQPPVGNVSLFHGNLVRVTHGRPHETVFRPPGEPLGTVVNDTFVRSDEAHWQQTRWGTVCRMPAKPLAYLNTEPGGEKPTRSALRVEVAGIADPWVARTDLIDSRSDDSHFLVETDELGDSLIRFGNGMNGRSLLDNAVVTCRYQVGGGSPGNVGADTLTGFDTSPSGFPTVDAVWNPLDAVDGRNPEAPEEIVRRAPQAYRSRQLRAVTLEDYARRAEELVEVSHAFARYAWTGSWRTVRVAIDPKGQDTLDDSLRRTIAGHLDAVRLIGEDLEICGARYAALDILLRVCAHPDYWPKYLEFELQQEFSDSHTADGRRGFFHPDHWTFGQSLHASQIIGRALAVTGIGRVLLLSMRRWHGGTDTGGPTVTVDPEDLPVKQIDVLQVEPGEIIQVASDPDHLEQGRIRFEVLGGRQ